MKAIKVMMLAAFMLAGSALFAGPRVFVGIGVGGGYGGYGYYAPPPPVRYVAPIPRPGYYYPAGPRYYWRSGYYARPPYAGAYWVGPRYYSHRYYRGYWRR